jgi:hypothetical protein
LRCLLPEDSDQVLNFSANPALSIACVELKVVCQCIAQQKTKESQLKQTLQQAMNDATCAQFTNG